MSGVGGVYRSRLEVLAAGEVVEAHLAEWAAAHQPTARFGPWRRVYGKLRPNRSPWALLVYEAVGAPTVQVRLLEGAGPLGRVEVLSCTADAALPGLPAVLAALDSPRVVRYHPGSRCTVHGGEGASARYVKVLAEDADDQEEVRGRWAASVSGALSFAVAEPHGWDPRSRSSWYGVVPGRPLTPHLLDPHGAGLARLVGMALGQLATAPLKPNRVDDAAVQLARTRRGLARAEAATPGLSAGLRTAADSLGRAHERLAPRPLVPVHGAAHLGQWLVDDEGRLGLVDFDRFACGEPEFDLATFLVELRDLSKEQGTDELEDAVLGGFRAVAGEPDPERLALYVLHKRVAKVARTAASLRPDAEERAAPLLDELRSPLAGLAAH